MSTYQYQIDSIEQQHILAALDTHAQAIHAQCRHAADIGLHEAATQLYAEAVNVELLAHRLAHVPSLDDVLRMLQGVTQ